MKYPMTIEEFRKQMSLNDPVGIDGDLREMFHILHTEATELTAELNNSYHSIEEIVEIFSRLTGQKVPKGFYLSPPFYTDCGKNIHLGENVTINVCCKFQDQGGIFIDDGALIGHSATIVTLNHMENPAQRDVLIHKPVHIGKKVWLGANVTILPGVTIGDGAIIGAGSLVTKNIPANVIAVGSPARIIREIKTE